MTDFRKGTETQYPSTAQESCIHVLTPAYLPAAEVSGGGGGAADVSRSYTDQTGWVPQGGLSLYPCD